MITIYETTFYNVLTNLSRIWTCWRGNLNSDRFPPQPGSWWTGSGLLTYSSHRPCHTRHCVLAHWCWYKLVEVWMQSSPAVIYFIFPSNTCTGNSHPTAHTTWLGGVMYLRVIDVNLCYIFPIDLPFSISYCVTSMCYNGEMRFQWLII